MQKPENAVKRLYKLMTSYHRDVRYRLQDVQDNSYRQYVVFNKNAEDRHKELRYTLYAGFGLCASLIVGVGVLDHKTNNRERLVSEALRRDTAIITPDNEKLYQVEPLIKKGPCEVFAVWPLDGPRPDKPVATFTLPGMPECEP